MIPAAVRIAVLVNPANAATSETVLRDIEPAIRSGGLLEVTARTNFMRALRGSELYLTRHNLETGLVGGCY